MCSFAELLSPRINCTVVAWFVSPSNLNCIQNINREIKFGPKNRFKSFYILYYYIDVIKMRNIALSDAGVKLSQATSHHSDFPPTNIIDK